MRIYVSHSSSLDYENELYKPLQEAFGADHELVLPHQSDDRGINMREVIPACDIVLAEVSYPSTGQGIELGWASAANIHVIAFYRHGSSRSSALEFVATDMFEYETKDDMLDGIRHHWKQ